MIRVQPAHRRASWLHILHESPWCSTRIMRPTTRSNWTIESNSSFISVRRLYPTWVYSRLIKPVSADSDYVFRPFRAIWFSMAMTDASAFLVSLANAAMFLDQIHRRKAYQYEKSVECLTFYGKCVKEVTRRLENSNDRVSAGVITTILGLICHEVRAPASVLKYEAPCSLL